jgi:hypothetical protein
VDPLYSPYSPLFSGGGKTMLAAFMRNLDGFCLLLTGEFVIDLQATMVSFPCDFTIFNTLVKRFPELLSIKVPELFQEPGSSPPHVKPLKKMFIAMLLKKNTERDPFCIAVPENFLRFLHHIPWILHYFPIPLSGFPIPGKIKRQLCHCPDRGSLSR